MKTVLLTFFLFGTLSVFSQGEANNWYFGYGAGLKFNNGNVTSVNNGRLSTNEGCASISDKNGQLLFYTDGRTVYTRNHSVMQNGNGLFGDSSSSQSAIIVPQPGNDNIYYIFTVDNALDGRNFGFNYSIVDMAGDAGLGAITNKNKNLLSYCSEKITAVRKDCLSGNYWVLTSSTPTGIEGVIDTYHAFQISSEGVDETSVKSTFRNGGYGVRFSDPRGYLVFSPDGSTVASANMQNGLFLYDFDTTTGYLSNQISLPLDTRATAAYGVAFSSNNNVLYVHSSNDYFQRNGSNDDATNHFSVLTQFNLQSPNIQQSAFIVDAQMLYRGALQLGPDGKIYRALSISYNIGSPYLGVINNPDQIGANCDYEHNAISLSPDKSAQGLPPFIQSIFNTQIDIVHNGDRSKNLSLCEGESFTLVAEFVPDAIYTWKRDGLLIESSENELTITTAGHYEVAIDPNGGECLLEGEAFVVYNDLPDAPDINLYQCDIDGQDDGVTTFNLDQTLNELTNNKDFLLVDFYINQNDVYAGNIIRNKGDFVNSSNPQTLYYKIMDTRFSCENFGKVELKTNFVQLSKLEVLICDDDGEDDGFHEIILSETEDLLATTAPLELDVSFYRTPTDALLEINKLSENYTNEVKGGNVIYSRIEDQNACYGINEIDLIIHSVPELEDEDSIIYCLNNYPNTVILTAGIGNKNSNQFTYLWSNGKTLPEIEINEPGTYIVTVTNASGCENSRQIEVLSSDIATIENIEVTDASDHNSLIVVASGAGIYEYAIDSTEDFQSDPNFTNVIPGIHTVYVRDINGCGLIEDQVSVIGFPKFFTPNGDGINDTWQVKGLSSRFQPNSIIYIYDRYGKLLMKLDSISKGWDGTFNGESLPTSDYWFSVQLEDGRIFSNHFTLKR